MKAFEYVILEILIEIFRKIEEDFEEEYNKSIGRESWLYDNDEKERIKNEYMLIIDIRDTLETINKNCRL